ncbi:hypothetical protein [Rugosimonospora africana]|uniref:Uncharacterized protein n=1 Tax=Rugosimonospora africana TaxID=556532 RepID=A0A8J3QL41_9ACTN|nr:hypothetical protein [Rugosimonospora africana]GIH12975.1 hypothetical protein Raf01_11470 [Rugosimonospora africana]
MDRLRPEHTAPALLPLLRRPGGQSRNRWRRAVNLVLHKLGVLADLRDIGHFTDFGDEDGDWEQDILDGGGPPGPSRWRPASRLSDHLAVICVGTGCTGVLAIIVIEFMHPTPIGLTAIGAIAAAAFRAGSVHGLRRNREDR